MKRYITVQEYFFIRCAACRMEQERNGTHTCNSCRLLRRYLYRTYIAPPNKRMRFNDILITPQDDDPAAYL